MGSDYNLSINPSTYDWTVRAIRALRTKLGINIMLHGSKGVLNGGQIFLFNHFARFETFIPQFLLFEETGAWCRSVASPEFFTGGDSFGRYLLSVGAVPNDYSRILPFLAEEILRGRKIIVFPEGGMVKDRRVLDERGDYSVFSRSAGERRKHHSGAAVLSLTLDAFKSGLQAAVENGNLALAENWAKRLDIKSVEDLLDEVKKPTLIVPSNITFFPLRVGGNMLHRGVELFNKGLSARLSEELRIEGNLLLKKTDMDVRLGLPAYASGFNKPWEKKILRRVVERIERIDEMFVFGVEKPQWDKKLIAWYLRRKVDDVRNYYMREMYLAVSVHLNHLASNLIINLVDRGQSKIERRLFHKMLYLTVKQVQKNEAVHLHRSLLDPEGYLGLMNGGCKALEQLFKSEGIQGLASVEDDSYVFLSKLREESEFDRVRLENMISVYANEVAPIKCVAEAVSYALEKAPGMSDQSIAYSLFDDEIRSFHWDKRRFSKVKYGDINSQETANECAEPFLLMPEKHRPVTVLMVHGFLASPAEMRGAAEHLTKQGYGVLGIRLKGHGTSPWDLRERSREEWMASVRRGFEILKGFSNRICVAGFSTGGMLALRLASEHPDGLVGVCTISAPIWFRNKNLVFVPFVHGANRLSSWVSSAEGVMPFRPNEPEHPNVNYRNIPVRGLWELRKLVDETEKRLGDVKCPVSIIQADNDPVVDPKSAEHIHTRLTGTKSKGLRRIESGRHGILYEDVNGTRAALASFLASLDAKVI